MSDAISLDLARENGIHTIAFPAISTGVYGYPVREATKVAVDAVKKWLEDNSDYPMEVTFCCFDVTVNPPRIFSSPKHCETMYRGNQRLYETPWLSRGVSETLRKSQGVS